MSEKSVSEARLLAENHALQEALYAHHTVGGNHLRTLAEWGEVCRICKVAASITDLATQETDPG